MRRRQFLRASTAVGVVGLLAGCAGNGTTTEGEGADSGTKSPPATPTTTADGKPLNDTGSATQTPGSVGWTTSGVMDGVSFEFSAAPPQCGQGRDTVDITFDTDASAVRLDGVISGSDLCKRARLADLSFDRGESHLSVAIETIDREGAGACAQCIGEIDYQATISFEGDLPRGVSVSHDGQGVASAAHGSSSAGPPSETATK